MDTTMVISDKVGHIVKLMQMSTMDQEEKNAWLQLLPVMNDEELTRLETTLANEVEKITDTVLEVLAMRTR